MTNVDLRDKIADAVSAVIDEHKADPEAVTQGFSMWITCGWVSDPARSHTVNMSNGRSFQKNQIEQVTIPETGNPFRHQAEISSQPIMDALSGLEVDQMVCLSGPLHSQENGSWLNYRPKMNNQPGSRILGTFPIPRPYTQVELAEKEAEEAKRRAANAELRAADVEERMKALEAQLLAQNAPAPKPSKPVKVKRPSKVKK